MSDEQYCRIYLQVFFGAFQNWIDTVLSHKQRVSWEKLLVGILKNICCKTCSWEKIGGEIFLMFIKRKNYNYTWNWNRMYVQKGFVNRNVGCCLPANVVRIQATKYWLSSGPASGFQLSKCTQYYEYRISDFLPEHFCGLNIASMSREARLIMVHPLLRKSYYHTV